MDQVTTPLPVQRLSFFSRVAAELKRLFAHAPGWEASAAATLTYIAPMVEVILTLVDPEAALVVSGLIQHAQSAMAAAAVVIKDAGPGATLITYLNAIESNIGQIAGAAQVKDPASQAKLNLLVSTITGEVNAIITAAKPVSA